MARNASFDVGKNINFPGMVGITPKEEPETQEQEIVTTPKSIEQKPKSSTKQSDIVPNKSPHNEEVSASISLHKKSKETRSVKKNFLFTPTLAKKLAECADELGISQNDLVNEMLTQFFQATGR